MNTKLQIFLTMFGLCLIGGLGVGYILTSSDEAKCQGDSCLTLKSADTVVTEETNEPIQVNDATTLGVENDAADEDDAEGNDDEESLLGPTSSNTTTSSQISETDSAPRVLEQRSPTTTSRNATNNAVVSNDERASTTETKSSDDDDSSETSQRTETTEKAEEPKPQPVTFNLLTGSYELPFESVCVIYAKNDESTQNQYSHNQPSIELWEGPDFVFGWEDEPFETNSRSLETLTWPYVYRAKQVTGASYEVATVTCTPK